MILLITGCVSGNVKREIISTSRAPAAIGPYSQAVCVGNSIYLSGQIAIKPETGIIITGDIEQQTQQVLENIRVILNTAGFKLCHVVKSMVFLSDLNNYAAMNKIYTQYFPDEPPARAVVQVVRLPKDVLVEIMVEATK
jgi:2-iminobutanoate/2-iminopropanoate deaminase